MTRWWLGDDVGVRVAYDDTTRFGSPTTERPAESTRRLFQVLMDEVVDRGLPAAVRSAPASLEFVAAHDPAFAEVATPSADGWCVHDDVLYPDPALARPSDLAFVRPTGEYLQATIPPAMWPLVHELVAQLSSQGCDDDNRGLDPDIRGLLDGLRQRGLVGTADGRGEGPAGGGDLTFVGHNTVVVRGDTATVMIDPFLFASDPAYPASYQPMSVLEIGPVDAVLVTHSHPDHFDPASLLRLPRDVKVIVPPVERETLLAVAMARRLTELGFTNVHPLQWGEGATIGDIRVSALPFFGEQPTDGAVLHPEIRNCGNTYVVATPRFSAAFVADSGRDGAGDVRDVAAAWRRDHGAIDYLFSGYRGWATYPLQLLFSSVAAFFLFVPRAAMDTRLQLMNDVVDAVDLAERFGARYLVPYGDGGAPWHWDAGLGPRLDGSGTEDLDFDPYPDRVRVAAERRVRLPGGQWLRSPVEVLLLRPGDAVVHGPERPGVVRRPGHAWPYDESSADMSAR